VGQVIVADEEACHLEGARIALRAQWVADQWTFAVLVRGSDDWQQVLQSSRASAAGSDIEIAGPVFQQAIARETSPGTAELLLIGQFGRRHFSGAITVADTEVHIEMADRWIVPLPMPELRWEWEIPPGQAVARNADEIVIAGLAAVSVSEAKRESARQESERFVLTAAVTESCLQLRHAFREIPLPPGTMQYRCRIQAIHS
jgi:hypothetical protein